MKTPVTLTIAGSDCSGGAGIQADLKTFSALQTYGCSVITAITAQNTHGVQVVEYLSPEIVIAQCKSIFSDLNINAIKVGMLGTQAIIEALADYLESLHIQPPLILDPVMVSTSGDTLLENSAIQSLKERLIPKASLITPNLPESAVLLNTPAPENTREMKQILENLHALGSKAVLLKGGHLKEAQSTDLFFNGKEVLSLSAPHIETKNTHGTGCSLSSAVTAYYARGYSMREAIIEAKNYVHNSILHADELQIGDGNGPVHHFAQWWNTNGGTKDTDR